MSGAEVEDTCWWREPLRDGVVDVPGAMSQKDSSWLCVCARVQARPMSWKVSLPGSVPHIIMCVCVCVCRLRRCSHSDGDEGGRAVVME